MSQEDTIDFGFDESESDAAQVSGVDPCIYHPENSKLPEQSRAVVHTFSCHAIRWFDGLFGDDHEFPTDEVSGELTTGFTWSEYDGFDPKLRFRVNAPLPNLNGRVNAFLGRVEEEAYIRDTKTTDQSIFREGIEDDQERSWLLGLGYKADKNKNRGWDYSIGVRLRLPPRPYAKVRYHHDFTFGSKTDLRFRETFFWRKDRGFGSTTHFDLAHDLGERDLLRWETIATISEITDGVEWWTGATHYHHLGGQSALATLLFVRGETSAPVELEEYGIRFTWRRPVARDWLFIEFGPSISWPRERIEEKRELSLGLGVSLKMQFGDYRY